MSKDSKGLSVGKSENFSEWYTEVVQKAELADYAPIRGFMVIRPGAYSIWEKIQEEFNSYLKKSKIDNAYFPLLIPESFFKKEAEHAQGFAPELAYIEGKEEGERLAIRPTSETIMYDSYSKWIRSYKQLPFKLNQWCNVLRWEVKQTKPFIRTREFLWQEGHCAFSSKSEAEKDMHEIIQEYKRLVEEFLGVPLLMGRKSRMETFPGAETTMTIEALMPDGKALQCGTSHNLGQGFAKVFDIKYKDKNEREEYVWQTSWGFSTRLIGALVMVHGDDRGLVLPPEAALNKGVIVPIIFDSSRDKVLKKARELEKKLSKFGVMLDDREGYSAGFKFSEWEMKGIPIRIEIGPKDIEKKQVTLVRRDNGKKESVNEKIVEKRFSEMLDDMQKSLLLKAKKFLDERIDSAKDMRELKRKLGEGKIVRAYFVDDIKVEKEIKEETGAASRIVEDSKKESVCVMSGKKTKTVGYFAKSY